MKKNRDNSLNIVNKNEVIQIQKSTSKEDSEDNSELSLETIKKLQRIDNNWLNNRIRSEWYDVSRHDKGYFLLHLRESVRWFKILIQLTIGKSSSSYFGIISPY